ncbi:MAG: hypothetical protein JMN27_18295 [gamma proteobacterium endosymbiont of Lamellibrachia anaximandri]|nr:hypothetical protein [gamma proteobacterium endosymbiont of Lamellibrachia anaximandri]MBL3535756.1 hypothetical protein [gamma proteobacterium endosymbiont of Lamellibrachia anaximandri]
MTNEATKDEANTAVGGLVDPIVSAVIEEYQCPGCVCGSDTECYEKGETEECKKHVAGTMIMPVVGKVFLGMPTGFNRIGPVEKMQMFVFKEFVDGWGYDKFNVPVWKRLDKNGNTLVRGMNPRINFPFLHVFIGNHLDKIDCLEITDVDIEGMD